MAVGHLRIKVDRDWIALVAYHMALEAIIEETADAPPWQDNTAAEIAQRVLDAFPERDR